MIVSARSAGLVGCRSCGIAAPAGQPICARCGARLKSRDALSLQKVWAWWAAGLIAYIPANTYPMLRSTQLFKTTESTIAEGVVELIQHSNYLIAAIVFIASIVIPIGKFIVIAYIAVSLGRGRGGNEARMHRLHAIVEFIGRWSMIDVFVVAILSAMVQFEAIATVNPGIAAVSFAVSVVFTMFSAQSFDSRLFWDKAQTAQRVSSV